MQICPNCGEENPDRFRLCGICGTPLATETRAPEVRKTVTVVFSDLKGSTTLGERLDTEALREVLNRYFSAMKAVLERHGGTVEKFIGDAIMAVFGLPTLHEDDALRAVRAAHEMKGALERLNDELQTGWAVRLENRTGVNTGEVVAGDVTAGQRLVTGDTVNTAARLEQNCPPLEVLIGEPTYRLVRDAVEIEPVEPLELKGKAERVPAYRLVSVRGGEAMRRHLDAPMVGRRAEMTVLEEALQRAKDRLGAQLVTVFGPAGVGKSRLLLEYLARTQEEASSLHGHCLSYGDGITFWPLAEIARSAAGITNDDSSEQARSKLRRLVGDDAPDVADRLASAIGLSEHSFAVEETFWAARRLLEILSSERPLVVLIDDIHWAEATFLDLLRFVVDTSLEAPLVLVCSARPELLEDHAEWIKEDERTRRIILDPLSEDESRLVIGNLLGGSELGADVRSKIIEAADGNPLFVEQMLSMLIDDGVLQRDESGGWLVLSDLGAITIPPSISALLTARLDRLRSNERTVIERAAVIGQVFFQGAVEALSPDDVRAGVPATLESLTRKELIGPGDSTVAGQVAFRFLHILIRDAAYSGLLKRTRAELHVAFVDWLEQTLGGRTMEYEEIRGYHLEQAFLTSVQLAPIDDRARAIGERGAVYLSSAGRRASARGDMPAAANLLQRAAALLPRGIPERVRLLIEAADALTELAEFSTADVVLQTALEEARDCRDEGLATVARVARLHLDYFSRTEDSNEDAILREVAEAIPILERLGDHEGLARAWRLQTTVHWTALRNSEAERSAERTIEHARLAGNELMQKRFMSSLAMAALYGPTPVHEAIKRCEVLLAEAGGDHKCEALVLATLARLESMEGRFDAARDLYRRSRAILEEMGWKLYAALTSLDSGPIEMLADDPVAAEAELRRDYDALRQMGERNYVATTAGLLAEALYQQGRYDESEELSGFAEDVAVADDVASQVHWRCVRAKVLARRGRPDVALELAREAVRLVLRTDEPDSQGTAILDLAEVLVLAGRFDDAMESVRQAQDIFEAKGNVVSAARAGRLLNELTASKKATSIQSPQITT